MKIGIDARVLMDGQYSGVGEYVHSLIDNILALDKTNEYFLFYNSLSKNVVDLPKFAGAQIVKRSIPNKILNYCLFRGLERPSVNELMGVDLDVFLMPHINFISLTPKTKNILTVHDLSFLQYSEFFAARRSFWHRALAVPKMVHKFDKVVAISENTKRDLMSYCQLPSEKIQVIHSGVGVQYSVINDNAELARVKQKLNLPEKFVLYLGTIEPRKNLLTLIKAYEKMRQDYSELAEVKLVLAGGRGWRCQPVYDAASRSLYSKDIIFTGYIEACDKPALYNLAELFVFPSFYEGFGFPPLEAAACGIPVVTSATSSLPEVLDNALFANPDDANELSIVMVEALLDQAWRKTATEQGLIKAQKFSWATTAQSYIDIFNNK